MFIESIKAFAVKIITWKKGGSFIFSLGASMISTAVFEKLNNIFFKDAEIKDIWLPVLIEIVMIFLYQGMIVIDFYFGYRVAKKIRGESFDKDRAMDTMAKACAMVLMTATLVFFAMISAAVDFNIEIFDWVDLSVSALICISISVFWFLAIGFEFISIGKHLEAIYGYKMKIFEFFESLLNFIRDKFFDSLSNISFKPSGNEKNSNKNNPINADSNSDTSVSDKESDSN